MSKKAIIFDICHFRNEDGPGIRTMIFFKGCPLRCLWCSNPFGLSKKPQLAVNFDRCTGCGNCVPVCPNAVNEVVEGKVKVDFAKCTACGNCVPVCPTAARKITGKEYTARELYLEVIKDTSFYRKN